MPDAQVKTEVQEVVEWANAKAFRETLQMLKKDPAYVARVKILQENDHLAYK